jgi:hypothetical protein
MAKHQVSHDRIIGMPVIMKMETIITISTILDFPLAVLDIRVQG